MVSVLRPLALLSLIATPLAAEGDARNGKRVFNKCRVCHVLREDVHRTGPSLYDIVGTPAAQVEGFRYSDVMATSGLVWDEETLTSFLLDPRGFLPGNRMSYAGLRSEQEVADLIAYLIEASK